MKVKKVIMPTIKNCTDIKQSERLAKILPLKSADMDYIPYANKDGEYSINVNTWDNDHDEDWIPCWSLAQLIEVLPADLWDCNKHCHLEIIKQQDDKQDESSILYIVRYFYYKVDFNDINSKNPDFNRTTHISSIGSNLIDACVNMIITLHEHKLLNKR